MKLSKKLNLSFIIAILISIATISITSTIMINNRFENYLVRERENKFDRISSEINEMFTNIDSNIEEMDILHYALTEDINIKIVDTNNKLVYNSNRQMGMGNHGGMHGGMMNRNRNIPVGHYIEKAYPLIDNVKSLFCLLILYIVNSSLTDSALFF